MGSYLVHVDDAQDISDRARFRPVGGATQADLVDGMRSRFLGRSWAEGPWVVYNERRAGHETAMHKHFANRIEFLIDGRIEWNEKGREPVVYGPGTMSYVDAGTVYGFTVLEDAKILVAFDGDPSYEAAGSAAGSSSPTAAGSRSAGDGGGDPGAYLVHYDDRPDISKAGRSEVAPGASVEAVDAGRLTRFLGRDDGPWVFYVERAAGDVNPMHRHGANRVEFIIDGEIEWREPGKEPVVYGAGTMSYVDAGTTYGFTVLRDCKILMVFDGSPGINYL
jgi:uncharacterized cupin superfamily protein